MGRYTGPKHRLARREGINILEKTSASLMRRLNVLPGVHGKKGRRRLSEYGQQLREKQKAKAMYGVYEKQFKQLVDTASRLQGDTEELLLAFLERRLDNVVYRLGMAKSRMMARQMVSHGHILVNDKKMSIPSYTVEEGDIIAVNKNMQTNAVVTQSLTEKSDIVAYLEKKGTLGKVVRLPKAGDFQAPFNTRQIIEYYSR